MKKCKTNHVYGTNNVEMGMSAWLRISKNRNQRMNVTYLSMTYDTRWSVGGIAAELGQKYAGIAVFELFYPCFIFCVDRYGDREKEDKQFRTVKIVIELDCGNTKKKSIMAYEMSVNSLRNERAADFS